jgi:hypothetical protein
VSKTISCNYSLEAPDDERKYGSKHVEQSRNNGIINCPKQLHIVGRFCEISYVAIIDPVVYSNCSSLPSISLVQELKLLTGIRRMLVSKPGLNIGHHYWRFSWFFSVTPRIVESHQIRQLTTTNKIQQDAPVLIFLKLFYFLLFRSTCFGHPCTHHQEPSILPAFTGRIEGS